MEVGSEFIVQVRGDEFAGPVDGSLLVDAIDEDDNDGSGKEEGQNPQEEVQVCFLFIVAGLEKADDFGALTFEVVTEGELLDPFTDRKDVAMVISSVGERGDQAAGIGGVEVELSCFPKGEVGVVRKNFDFAETHEGGFGVRVIRAVGFFDGEPYEAAARPRDGQHENRGSFERGAEVGFEQGDGIGEIRLIGALDEKLSWDSKVGRHGLRNEVFDVGGVQVDLLNATLGLQVDDDGKILVGSSVADQGDTLLSIVGVHEVGQTTVDQVVGTSGIWRGDRSGRDPNGTAKGEIFLISENEDFRELEDKSLVPGAGGKFHSFDSDPGGLRDPAGDGQGGDAREEVIAAIEACHNLSVGVPGCSGDHAEGAREAIGGQAFPGEASDGGDQDDEVDVLFVVESDLNPLGIGAGLMTLGSMANRADSTSHGEVGELAELGVDALQFFFQLVGREVVETGFLPPRRSDEQEC